MTKKAAQDTVTSEATGTPAATDATTTQTPEDEPGARVAEIVDAENEQGFVGNKVDPTPNANYTLHGVTHDAPTPENDPETGRAVADYLRGGAAGDGPTIPTAAETPAEPSRTAQDDEVPF